MTTVAIIPARGGSKGIPRKNLVPFCGRPLLYWTVVRAVASALVEATYVSSDSDEILARSAEWGAVPIRRPDAIAGDAATSESALLHALDAIPEEVDVVVFLQATSPLRKPSDIDGALKRFRETAANSLFSAANLQDFIVWHRDEDGLTCLNYDWRRRVRRQERSGATFVENGSIYVFEADLLRRTNNRLGGRIEIFEMALWQSFEIDDPKQLEFCEVLFKHYIGDHA